MDTRECVARPSPRQEFEQRVLTPVALRMYKLIQVIRDDYRPGEALGEGNKRTTSWAVDIIRPHYDGVLPEGASRPHRSLLVSSGHLNIEAWFVKLEVASKAFGVKLDFLSGTEEEPTSYDALLALCTDVEYLNAGSLDQSATEGLVGRLHNLIDACA